MGGLELSFEKNEQATRFGGVLPAGSALLLAGGQYCPAVRIPLSVHQTTAPVSNRPVNNSMPKRIFSLNCNLECITK